MRAKHPGSGLAPSGAVLLSPRLALAGVACCLAAGCGLAHLQTAKTLPRGKTRTTIGDTLITSGLENGRPPQNIAPQVINPLALIPLHLQVRRGITDRIDIGGTLLWGIGIGGDVKVNLLPPEWRAALAVSGGVGGAVWLNNDGIYVLQVPATVTGSVEVAPWFTPYAAVGYRALWAWGADDQTMVGSQATSPTGAGEGWVAAFAGVELRRATGRAVLFEYGRIIPVTHDSGHAYWMAPSNMFSIAFRTGEGPSALER